MKKRLLTMALSVIALMCVMTIGASAEDVVESWSLDGVEITSSSLTRAAADTSENTYIAAQGIDSYSGYFELSHAVQTSEAAMEESFAAQAKNTGLYNGASGVTYTADVTGYSEDATSVDVTVSVSKEGETGYAVTFTTFTVGAIEKTFEVYDAASLYEAVNDTSKNKVITFVDDITVDWADYPDGFNSTFYGGTIDGNGYTLDIYADELGYYVLLGETSANSYIKDLNVTYSGGYLTALVQFNKGTFKHLLMKNIVVLDLDENQIIETSYANSPFVNLNWVGHVTLRDCVNNEQLMLSTAENYTAIFYAQYLTTTQGTAGYGGTVTLDGCINNGSLYGYRVAFTFGNAYNATAVNSDTVKLIDCENNGSIIGTGSAGVFASYNTSLSAMNAIYGDGGTNEIIGADNFSVIDEYSTLSAVVEDDGTIVITDTAQDLSGLTYQVVLQAQAYMESGNGRQSTFTEYTAAATVETTKAAIFIRETEFEELFPNEETYIAPWADIEGGRLDYEIAVIKGKLYYVFTDESMNGLVFSDGGSTASISISIYNSNDMLIGWKSVSQNSSAVVPDIVCTINDIAFFGTLDEAVTSAEDDDVITIYEDIELASAVKVASDITITGATGTETISASYNTSENNGLFVVEDGVTAEFTNLTFTVDNFGITNEALANTATIIVDGCTFNSDGSANSAVSGDWSTNVGNHYSLTFTNNVVNGPFNKPLHIILMANDQLIVSGNTFTGTAADGSNRSLTIIAQDERASISITNNTFDTLYKAISVDSWTATPSFTLTGNSFVNCIYSLDVSSANDCNDGLSLAYNYFGGDLPVVLDSSADVNELYSNDTNASELVFYPYYSNAGLTTLVYEDEDQTVEDVVTEILADLDSLDTSDTTAVNEAALLVALADTTTLIEEDESLIDAINALDDAFLAVNGNIDVDTTLTALPAEDYTIEDVAVAGLALAVYGSAVPADTVVLTLDVDQIVSTEDVDLAFTAVPYVSINGGEETKVDNEDLNAPITFKVYLPEEFEGNRATVLHENSEGTEVGTYTLSVYTDADGNKYIQITVTEFSTFYVTGFTYTSSGTSYYTSSVASTSNGSVSISSSKSTMNSTITITATPDDGYEVGDVSVTYASGKTVSVTDNGDGTYSYKQPGASVTVTVTFVESDGSDDSDEEDDTFFIDVDTDDYFYDAVLWAVENGITAGTTDTTFSPNTVCNRAQAVTFLYRAAGEPSVAGDTAFTDLDEDGYYYDAVLWAVSEGITAGTTDTTFSAYNSCTRGQIVTFLYRAAGAPEVEGDALDVDADSYCYDAVIWAVENGITTGYTDGTFGANDYCTRAQIVTFLYRFLAD